MFVYDEDTVDIKIHYRKKGYQYEAYTDTEFKSLKIEDNKRKTFSEVSIKMKELTFGLYNTLQEEAMVEGADGERRFNFKAFKENRLKKLIKEWDANDREGNVVKIQDKTIEHIAPAIAEAILRAYDETSLVSEEEEKNS